MGVRYIAAPSRNGPDGPRGMTIPGLRARLGDQLDLAELQAPSGLVLYQNTAWFPAVGVAADDAAIPTGDVAPIPAALSTSLAGDVKPLTGRSVDGQVLLAQAYDEHWRATASESKPRHHESFGWANQFGPTVGTVAVDYSDQRPTTLMVRAERAWLIVRSSLNAPPRVRLSPTRSPARSLASAAASAGQRQRRGRRMRREHRRRLLGQCEHSRPRTIPAVGRLLRALLVLAAFSRRRSCSDRQTPEVHPPRRHRRAAGSICPARRRSHGVVLRRHRGRGGSNDEWVEIASLSPTPEATITGVSRRRDEPGRATSSSGAERAPERAQVLGSHRTGSWSGVGGPAIVEHELRGTLTADLAMGPCAHEPSRRWYFAAGDTAKGSAQQLELFNPFGDDAILDVTFITDDGVQEPTDLQGFVVGRHSKAWCPSRTWSSARSVATQIVTGPAASWPSRPPSTAPTARGPPVLGSIARREWTVPFGDAGPGITSTIASNFACPRNRGVVPCRGRARTRTIDAVAFRRASTGRVPAGSGRRDRRPGPGRQSRRRLPRQRHGNAGTAGAHAAPAQVGSGPTRTSFDAVVSRSREAGDGRTAYVR